MAVKPLFTNLGSFSAPFLCLGHGRGASGARGLDVDVATELETQVVQQMFQQDPKELGEKDEI